MLRRFDGVCAHSIGVDARHLAVARQHRLQPRDAHLDSLLHHVIEARRLERRKQVVQVGRRGLLPRLGADFERGLSLLARDGRAPFAVAAVKDENAIARAQAQNVGEVMGLRLLERDADAFPKRRRDVKTG